MRFSELFARHSKVFSYEFFPPRQSAGLSDTLKLISDLADTKPHFMTVTYGAGGGTRGLTREIVSFIKNNLQVPAVAHLTCAGHEALEIDQIVDDLLREGVNNILALRGDPPKNSTSYDPQRQGFQNALELVGHLHKRKDLSIAVAGYPETHKDAESPQADLEYLKRKIDAGAEVVFTQLFFDNSFYFRFVDKMRALGVTVPLVPGIMPIASVSQIKRFTDMCGASFPKALLDKLSALESDEAAVLKFGTEYAIRQCQELLQQGAPGIHLYTLNRSQQARPLMEALRT